MQEYKTRQTLLQKLRDQYDDDAWNDFVSFYRPFIRAVIIKMNIDEADGDDISQKVLLQAWKSLGDFDYSKDKGRFRNWLAVVTRNEARMEMRNKYRQFDNPSSERHNELSLLLDSWTEPEIDRISQIEWQKHIVNLAWENVSPSLAQKVREAYELLSSGQDLKDVARHLEVAENSVYVYRQRVEKLICKEVIRLEEQLG